MVALLLAAVLQDPTTIRLSPPAQVKSEDIKKAAAVLESRCKAYGYDGVTAKVITEKVVTAKASKGKAEKSMSVGFVELSCKEGFTDAMQRIIEKLAGGPPICGATGAGVIKFMNYELAFTYYLAGAEADRFPAPEQLSVADIVKAKAPAGSKWAALQHRYTGPAPRPVLLHDTPRFTQDDFTTWFDGGPEKPTGSMNLKLTEVGMKKWAGLPPAIKSATPLLIYNGNEEAPVSGTFNSLKELKPKNKEIEVTSSCYMQPVDTACISHPIPFRLEPVK